MKNDQPTAEGSASNRVDTAGPRCPVWLGDAAMALSLSNLCLIRPWFSILYDADYGYHNQQTVNTPTLLGLGLNVLLLAAVFWLGATVVRGVGTAWAKRLAVLALLGLFVLPLNFIRTNYFLSAMAHALELARNPLVLAVAGAAGLLVLYAYQRTLRFFRAVLWIMLPLAAISMGKLLLAVTRISPIHQHTEAPALAPLLPAARPTPRVVWLVFDEFDYRLAFAERPAELRLPELDRLRRETLFATNAYPPADDTIVSLPALTTGRRVTNAAPSSANELQVTLEPDGEKLAWSAMPTVFSRARALGYNNAIVGWYHPYRRLFHSVASFCDLPVSMYDMDRGRNLGEAMKNQLWANAFPLQERRMLLQVHREAMAMTSLVITNQQFGLCLLHLPLPHLPGIYRPAEDRFTITHFAFAQGYFDNLALVDRVVGQLRRELENAGRWNDTWLIISSDHSWRESRRHDGQRDLRVPFLVKAPGSGAGMEYTPQFNTVMTHDLILAMLQEKLRTLPEIRDWLMQNRVDVPPARGLGSGDAKLAH